MQMLLLKSYFVLQVASADICPSKELIFSVSSVS